MDTPQSVGLLWTRDQPVAETSTWQTRNAYNRQTFMPSAGFEPAIPADNRLQTLTLRPLGHWDWPSLQNIPKIVMVKYFTLVLT
jgi:hypothetical protein